VPTGKAGVGKSIFPANYSWRAVETARQVVSKFSFCGFQLRYFLTELVPFTTTSWEKVTVCASLAKAGMPEARSSASDTVPAGRGWSRERAGAQPRPSKEAPALAKTALACIYGCLKVRK